MYIKYQKLKWDGNVIKSGSAAIVETIYVPNKHGNHLKSHSTERVVSKLGKVLWRNEENKNQGIFNTPGRGIVFYDLEKDEYRPVDVGDPRLDGTKFVAEPLWVHTIFGVGYVFFSVMGQSPVMNALRASFKEPRLFQTALAHIAHDCLKNGARIKCGEFLKSSVLSYVLTNLHVSTLDCDTAYFEALSDDNLKVAFFRALVFEMQKEHPNFGRCCYIDSTALPGEAENNPFNYLSCHTRGGEACIQTRLVLVMDIETQVPVWFDIIPANVLDKSTIEGITKDVEVTLGLKIDAYDLDAGYAREELFGMFNRDNSTYVDEDGIEREHTVLIRMPDAKGYPGAHVYIASKPHFYMGRYTFDYEHHTFFGERHEVNLLGHREYVFTFVDKTQAESLLREWRSEHSDEWNAMSDLAKDWYQVKFGYFNLVGNKDQTPEQALIEYRGRSKIEVLFRDGKTYLDILPISKRNMRSVMGKIFHDVIELTFYRDFRKRVAPAHVPMSRLLVELSGWMCTRISDTLVETSTANRQVRETLETLGYSVPGHVNMEEFRREILEGIPMEREPVTKRVKRTQKKLTVPISPEEKLDAAEKECAEREEKKAKAKEERERLKEEKRAERERLKEEKRAERERLKEEKRAERERLKEEKKAERKSELKRKAV